MHAPQTIPPIGIVLLAAGSSLRFGSPKQLLQFHEKSLLKHSVIVAEQSLARDVIVVTNPYLELEDEVPASAKVKMVKNTSFNEGMSSSVRCGLEALLNAEPAVEGALLMVCDQPFIHAELLNEIIQKYVETGNRIITSHYGDTFGPPTLFDRSLFEDLLQLTGDAGARKIVSENLTETVFVKFHQGSVDIDTTDDYMNLLKSDVV